MIAVDTSVVVRYLVGSPLGQARRATALIEGPERIGFPVVVLVESAHVLRTQYSVERGEVLDALLALVTRENATLIGMSTNSVVEALVLARSMPDRPIPDALIALAARDAGALPLFSFDRDMERYPVEVKEPT